MITIDGGTGIIRHNGVEVASEKMVDYWYLNTDIDSSAGDNDIPGSKFTRNDKTGGASQIGTGMTVDNSSGVWTFPTTGKYMIEVHLNNRTNTSDNNYLDIRVSVNGGSDYTGVKRIQSSASNTNSNGHSGSGEYFVNVTDTSQVKVKFFPHSIESGSYFEANDTSLLQSVFIFTRLSA